MKDDGRNVKKNGQKMKEIEWEVVRKNEEDKKDRQAEERKKEVLSASGITSKGIKRKLPDLGWVEQDNTQEMGEKIPKLSKKEAIATEKEIKRKKMEVLVTCSEKKDADKNYIPGEEKYANIKKKYAKINYIPGERQENLGPVGKHFGSFIDWKSTGNDSVGGQEMALDGWKAFGS